MRELTITYTPARRTLPKASCPRDLWQLIQERLERESVEVALAIVVDTKCRVLGVHEIGRGTLDSCIVHPRDVFKAALLANAAAVAVVHNHPSGDPTPSAEDISLCARLRQVGTLVGIDLLDFLIVGADSYLSFQEAGR